jgi:hypothetical protein
MGKKIDLREQAAELLPGAAPDVAIELLKDLHLLTRDGALNADARRKLKQVRHLLQLLAPALDDVRARYPEPVIVDCGAGKGYLGFLMYATRLASGRERLLAVESRGDLVPAAAERARRFGCERMELIEGSIAEVPLPERIHVVTALHACDTATDDALVRAISAHADWVAVVPCCQAEVARQLEAGGPDEPALAALCAHPWHRRELGAHLTNVVRALALEAHGYHVTVTELTGWEHALKNELILARRVKRFDREAQVRLADLLARFKIDPSLTRRLERPA